MASMVVVVVEEHLNSFLSKGRKDRPSPPILGLTCKCQAAVSKGLRIMSDRRIFGWPLGTFIIFYKR